MKNEELRDNKPLYRYSNSKKHSVNQVSYPPVYLGLKYASIASFYLVTKSVLTHVRVVVARVGVKLWQKSCKKEKRNIL
jgi:hypothetical protein